MASCCKKLLGWYGHQGQEVICKKWILPLRLAVLASLLGQLCWWLFHPVVFYTAAIVIIHGFVALRLLAECRRSEHYHRTLEEFERREAGLKGDST